ncbi:TonB-dependent siderophore receptor [Paraglaciecola chathamensis]|uniref:Iron complex outermembrane recepter protein n=1 Tax=Paraglaciecola chathamensis S18K6 TaxID=1127672 RepID=A0AAV3UT62_9ALTE|nr:TonB-dependent receptor [Paraglaciecola chathamensis]GAC08300.1 iron complex outermembrane recepter protein [Paraglaciecola chathamensis S18K6]
MNKKHTLTISVLAGAVSAVLSSTVNAQTSQEQEDVEKIEVVQQRQAYRGDVPLKSIPQNIDVVTAELLDDLGVNDLQNALDFTSGIARQNSFGGMWDSFAIRGFAGDENLPGGYLVNGFSAGRGYSGRRETSNIQSIEVIKGPGSALYGRSEPGGTINIITKKPQFSEEGYIQATIGSYDLYRLEGDYTNELTPDLAFRVNGAYEDAGSFRDIVETKKISVSPSILYNISDKTNIAYELEYLDQELPFDRGVIVTNNEFGDVPIDTFYGEPADGPIEIDATGHQITLQHELAGGWNLLAGLSYRESSFEGFSSEVEVGGRQLVGTEGFEETVNRRRLYRNYESEDLAGRIEFSGTFDLAGMAHHILIGADAYKYTLDITQDRWRVAWGVNDTTYSVNKYNPVYGQDLPSLSPTRFDTEDQDSVGVYIQDQIDITDKFKIQGGIRFDDFEQDFESYLSGQVTSQSQTATSPRVGLVYEASERYTLYASYSEGFRPNSGSNFDGETFEPEESKSYEAGVKFATSDESITGTVSFFRAEKSNVLAADPNPEHSGFSDTVGEAESQGVEVDLTTMLGDDTMLTVAYAYVDATTSNSIVNADWGVEIPAGTQLLNIPKNKLNLTAIHYLNVAGKDSKLGASLTYVDDRPGELIDPDYVLPSYTTVRLFGSVNITEAFSINADIENLFDKEYYASSYSALWTMPGNPRQAKLSVKYAF